MSSKYALVHAEEGNFPTVMMCRLLGIARSGFYSWRKRLGEPGPAPGSRAARRVQVSEEVHLSWLRSRRVYGVRRIKADLATRGLLASLWLIHTIMGELDIAGAQPCARKRISAEVAADAASRPDLVRREFEPPVPTTHLVGDITYLKTSQGWLFLATAIDLTTRMVVGWSTADNMRTSLVVAALNNAHKNGYVAGNAIFHSDRGTQYTSAEFATAARLLSVRLSVGATGVCWDNAVAESFFSMLKNEMFYRFDFATLAEARVAVADYIDFYNRRRLHSTLGYRTPADAMNEFDRAQTPTLTAA